MSNMLMQAEDRPCRAGLLPTESHARTHARLRLGRTISRCSPHQAGIPLWLSISRRHQVTLCPAGLGRRGFFIPTQCTTNHGRIRNPQPTASPQDRHLRRHVLPPLRGPRKVIPDECSEFVRWRPFPDEDHHQARGTQRVPPSITSSLLPMKWRNDPPRPKYQYGSSLPNGHLPVRRRANHPVVCGSATRVIAGPMNDVYRHEHPMSFHSSRKQQLGRRGYFLNHETEGPSPSNSDYLPTTASGSATAWTSQPTSSK